MGFRKIKEKMRCKKRNKRTSLPLTGTPAVLHVVEHDLRHSHTYSDFMFKNCFYSSFSKIDRKISWEKKEKGSSSSDCRDCSRHVER